MLSFRKNYVFIFYLNINKTVSIRTKMIKYTKHLTGCLLRLYTGGIDDLSTVLEYFKLTARVEHLSIVRKPVGALSVRFQCLFVRANGSETFDVDEPSRADSIPVDRSFVVVDACDFFGGGGGVRFPVWPPL